MYVINNKNDLYIKYLTYKLLYVCGQNFFVNSIFWTIVDVSVISGSFILCLAEPILNFQGPESIAGALEVGGPCHQWFIKMLVFKWYRSSFLRLMADQDKFWPIDTQGPIIEQQLTRTFNNVKKSFQIFLIASIATQSMMSIRPMIMLLFTEGDRKLPIELYNFIDLSKSPFYEIAYFTSVSYLYIVASFIIGFDGLFLTMCTGAIGQLVLLKEGMSKLEPANCKMFLPKYIEHHVFITNYIKDVKSIFPFLLLNQFFSSVTCICMAIYLCANYGTADIFFTARCSMFAFAGTVQIFIYCLTGSQVKSQLDSVAEAIGRCGWWKSNEKDLRLAVILITQKAQNSHFFKAGGMINLDLESFLGVLRTSFSFFTLMQAENKEE